MNGGMSIGGLGIKDWEIAGSGNVHKAMMGGMMIP